MSNLMDFATSKINFLDKSEHVLAIRYYAISFARVSVVVKTHDEVYVLSTIKISSYFSIVSLLC